MWARRLRSPERSTSHRPSSATADRCAPFWPTAFARLVGSPAPLPVAAWPRMTAGSASNIAAMFASRSYPPSTGATAQAAVAVTPATPLRTGHWHPAVQRWPSDRESRAPSTVDTAQTPSPRWSPTASRKPLATPTASRACHRDCRHPHCRWGHRFQPLRARLRLRRRPPAAGALLALLLPSVAPGLCSSAARSLCLR